MRQENHIHTRIMQRILKKSSESLTTLPTRLRLPYHRTMKRCLFAALVCFFATTVCWAEGPDDLYVRVYHLIQEGDRFSSSGQSQLARAKYIEAQTGLKQLQKVSPNWNTSVVQFRLRYLDDKLGAI